MSANPDPATAIQLLAESAVRAAESARASVEIIREQASRQSASSSGYSEANKVLKYPETFGSESHDSDLLSWNEWQSTFRAWLFFAEGAFEEDFATVDSHLGTPLKLHEMTEPTRSRASKLYAILSSLLKHRPKAVLRQLQERNGFECWRQLHNIYAPRNQARSMAILSAIMSAPQFTMKDKTLREQVLALDRMALEYTKASGGPPGDDVLLGTLIRVLPQKIREHIQLQMLHRDVSYQSVRDAVLGYELNTQTWSPFRVQQEAGLISKDDGGPQPMDISIVKGKPDKGKGKNKSKWQARGNSTGKGYSGLSKGKGYGDSTKGGKFSHGGRGYGGAGVHKGDSKGKRDKDVKGGKKGDFADSRNKCLYCGKYGHWKRDCHAYQADVAAGKVREIHASSSQSTTTTLLGSSSQTASSAQSDAASVATTQVTSASGVQAKRIQQVSGLSAVHELGTYVDRPVDLTIFDMSDGDVDIEHVCRSVCMVTESNHTNKHVQHLQHSAAEFHELQDLVMSTEPGADLCLQYEALIFSSEEIARFVRHVHRVPKCVRAVSVAGEIEIVLDSGADCSVLPRSFAEVGHDAGGNGGEFEDAQGNPLAVAGVRVADIDIGNFTFRDKFIVSDVKVPLIALGKMYRAGWCVVPGNWLGAGITGLCLTNGKSWAPVWHRQQSLCTTCRIRSVSALEVASVKAVVLRPPLTELTSSWTRIRSRCYAMVVPSQKFVDTTLIPLSELLWRRTTLARRNNVWELVEFSEDVATLESMSESIPGEGVDLVLTIAHDSEDLTPEDMGFEYTGESLFGPQSSASASSALGSSSSRFPHVPQVDVRETAGDVVMHQAPEDERAAELPVEDHTLSLPPESIDVDGTTIDAASSLATLRAACGVLGLATAGNKTQLFKRLSKHVMDSELLARHQVQHSLSSEMVRQPDEQNIAAMPSEEEKRKHFLTHEPFQPWCQACVSFRARQDRHVESLPHTGREDSVVSIDWGFLNRVANENKLTVLFVHDRQTKCVHAIPVPGKSKSSLSFVCTELGRFILWLRHQSVLIRCDNEPAVTAVASATAKILRSQGVQVTIDTTPVGSHASNGPVEQTVQSVRQLACVLIRQLEAGLGASEDKVLFGISHPIWSWAVLHSAWLKNRYRVLQGHTGFERATQSMYRGKICLFGERVSGFIQTEPKASPNWRQAVWLGKTVRNDVHVLAVKDCIFVSRSIRRFAEPFEQTLVAEIETFAWQHGLANLGGRLVPGNRRLLPLPEPEAITVGPLALPEIGSPSQQAASDPPTSSASSSAGLGPLDGESVTMDHAPSGATDQTMHTAVSITQGESGATADGNGGAVSAVHQQELVLLTTDVEFVPCEVYVRQVKYTHEDEVPDMVMEAQTVEQLEDYEGELLFEDEDDSDDVQFGEIDSRLCRSRTDDVEPQISISELTQLDVLADEVEIRRLCKLNVLLEPATLDGVEHVVELSTRMVRTWREKEHAGQPVWYRRSRYVAREYAWLSQRSDLYSPASSAGCNKLIPIIMMQNPSFILFTADISDAYLTVKQERPTRVYYTSPTGHRVAYALGRVLPGQRSGALDWYTSFNSFLESSLNTEACPAHPSLIKCPNQKAFMQLHVDDVLGCGEKRYANGVIQPTLAGTYKLTWRTVEKIGDAVTFLKKKHCLISDTELLITPHPKHFEKLFELMRIDINGHPKHTPHLSKLDELDATEPLTSDQAKLFRCCMGILMYVAPDVPSCQNTIRNLSGRMASPTLLALEGLRHLCKYLLLVREYGMVVTKNEKGVGLLGRVYPESRPVETYADSDWASCKATRRSISSGVICLCGNVMHSFSRTQRVVALSSGEAELYATASAMIEGIWTKMLVSFLFPEDQGNPGHHYLDSTAASGMLHRSGNGKVRHLSCRVLWCQQQVKEKIYEINKVEGRYNPADLGTKSLTKRRTLQLLYMFKAYHVGNSEFVGSEEYAQMLQEDAFKKSIKELRQRSSSHKTPVCKQSLKEVIAMCMLTLANGDALSPFFPQSRQFEWTDVVILLILIGVFFLGRWSTSTTTTTTSSSSTSLPCPPGQSSSSSSRTRPLTTTSTSTSTSTTRMRSTSRPTYTSDDPPMAGGVELSARLDALPEQSSLLEEEGATSSASGGLHAPPDEQLQGLRHRATTATTSSADDEEVEVLSPGELHSGCIPRYDGYDGRWDSFFLAKEDVGSPPPDVGLELRKYHQLMDCDHKLVDAYYRRRYGFGFHESSKTKDVGELREELKDVVIFNSNRAKSYHTTHCGMVQRQRRTDGGMLKSVTIKKARELQLMPCRQCNP